MAIAVIAATIAIAAFAAKLILTPDNLNRIVKQASAEMLNAQVKTDTIELHLFRNFPRITLSIKNGEVISSALDSIRSNTRLRIPAQADTLLKFKSFDISLSLLGLLNSDVNIRRAAVVSPELFAYVAPDGTANWDIFKDNDTAGTSTTDTATAEITSDAATESAPLPVSININGLSIKDKGSITYMSSPDSLMARVSLNRLMVRGNLSTEMEKLEVKRARVSKLAVSVSKRTTQNDSLHKAFARFVLDSLDITNRQNGHYNIAAISRSDIRVDDKVLAKDFPFEINGGIVFDSLHGNCGTLNDFTVSIAKVPVKFNGSFNV